MKRTFVAVTLVLALTFSLVAFSANADTLNKHELFGPTYSKAGTVYFEDTSKPAYLLLSLSGSPDATAQILSALDWFCTTVDYLNISDFVPGCSYVEAGNKFYKYVDKGMEVDVLYTDPVTGSEIWHGTLKDGDILYLGNDHPNGYTISFKCHGISYPFVQLILLDNVIWSK